MARRLAGELRADHPDAAASLLEGLEDMFTVRRLGVAGRLALTLTNTNCIESMISVARSVMGNVKRWRDGSMTALGPWNTSSIRSSRSLASPLAAS
jgi:putative transposase